jgi:uncharacterized protein (DUF433 family)
MSVQTLDHYIEMTPGILGGKPRIAGRRISVQNIVVWHEWMDWSADKIANEFDLTLAEIYSALAYYYNNPDEINQAIKDSQSFVEEIKRGIPSKMPSNLNE